MKPPFQPDACLGPLSPTLATVIIPDGVKSLVYSKADVGTFVDVVQSFKPGRAFVVSGPDGFIRFTMSGGTVEVVLTHQHGTVRYVAPREVTKVEVAFGDPSDTDPEDVDFSCWIEDLSSFAHASARAGGDVE